MLTLCTKIFTLVNGWLGADWEPGASNASLRRVTTEKSRAISPQAKCFLTDDGEAEDLCGGERQESGCRQGDTVRYAGLSVVQATDPLVFQ
jgi:hypothetical protein